jgi:hypothetical protein
MLLHNYVTMMHGQHNIKKLLRCVICALVGCHKNNIKMQDKCVNTADRPSQMCAP